MAAAGSAVRNDRNKGNYRNDGNNRNGLAVGRYAVVGLSIAACSLIAAGCGGSGQDGGSSDGGHSAAASQGAVPPLGAGPEFGLCGSVTDDELTATTGLPADLHVVRDPVGCQWDTGDVVSGSHVSFTWYRGSPIGRERTIDGAVGRHVQDVTIGGRPGFSSRSGPALCEVGVDYGEDFFLWSVAYDTDPPNGDVCAVAKSLATKTAERSQS